MRLRGWEQDFPELAAMACKEYGVYPSPDWRRNRWNLVDVYPEPQKQTYVSVTVEQVIKFSALR